MEPQLRSTFHMLLLTALVLLAGIILRYLLPTIPFESIALIYGGIVVAYLGTIYGFSLTARYNLLRNETHFLKNIDDRISNFDDAIERFKTSANLNWIITQDDLKKYESSESYVGDLDKVWVISLDLGNDVLDGEFFKIVEDNINRGVEYYYYVPKIGMIENRARQIHSALNWTTKMHWHFLDKERFDLVVGKNVGIYRTDRRISTRRAQDEAFVEIKFEKNIRWVRLDRELTEVLIVSLSPFPETHLKNNM